MATETLPAVEAVRPGLEPAGDFLTEVVRWTVQELMEAEVGAQIGAERYERTGERAPRRNGDRHREWDTRVGTLDLAIPTLRTGGSCPSWLGPRRRAEQALIGVIAEASVQGVSTRTVEALVQALGIAGIGASEVSRLCASREEQAAAFRTRRPDARSPYRWPDARDEHVREGHRVQTMAVTVADGARDDGGREVLGVAIGPSEDGARWRAFRRGLVARGRRGVRRATSDAHRGLTPAIRAVVAGAGWQRCRVNCRRTVSAPVSKGAQALAAATVRTIVEPPDRQAARAQLRQGCAARQERFPQVVALLAGGGRRELDLLRLPEGALAAGLLDHPAGATRYGAAPAPRGGRHPPQPGGGPPPGRGAAGRAGRGVAGRPPLRQPGVDGRPPPAARAGAARTGRGGGLSRARPAARPSPRLPMRSPPRGQAPTDPSAPTGRPGCRDGPSAGWRRPPIARPPGGQTPGHDRAADK
jgi:transposase-like protein